MTQRLDPGLAFLLKIPSPHTVPANPGPPISCFCQAFPAASAGGGGGGRKGWERSLLIFIVMSPCPRPIQEWITLYCTHGSKDHGLEMSEKESEIQGHLAQSLILQIRELNSGERSGLSSVTQGPWGGCYYRVI